MLLVLSLAMNFDEHDFIRLIIAEFYTNNFPKYQQSIAQEDEKDRLFFKKCDCFMINLQDISRSSVLSEITVEYIRISKIRELLKQSLKSMDFFEAEVLVCLPGGNQYIQVALPLNNTVQQLVEFVSAKLTPSSILGSYWLFLGFDDQNSDIPLSFDTQ